MSDVIQLLPQHVANQIAAGEVVQRPSSVVKELLENAVDAGASSIQLIIKDAGKTLIQVIDNGKGMSVTDARMSFERHATSKIHKSEDIFKIMTKGFRGEALASIAAVAQVEMKTKQAEDAIGTCVEINGGEFQSQQPTVTSEGTILSVKNLFYNVPARRNFLKSNNVEFRHILDEFHRVCLSHTDINFSLTHNDEEILRLNKTHLAQRILHIFGKKFNGQLIPITEETQVVKISGFVGKPEVAKKARGAQFFFVNHRFIKSSYLHKAIVDAFENLIPKGNHPSYFIFMELPPEKIDINIHPTKTEIKFEDEYSIFAQLRAATKHALGQHQIIPTLDFEQDENWEIPILERDKPISFPEISVNHNYNPFTSESLPPIAPSSEEVKTKKSTFIHTPSPTHGSTYRYYELEKPNPAQQYIEIESSINDEINVQQWNTAYLISSYKSNLLIIDQHRAHQLILFEKFKHLGQANTLSQQLLFPIEIPLTPKEKSLLEETLESWISFGFDLEISNESAMITTIPAELKTEFIPSIFEQFLCAEEIDKNTIKEEVCKIMAKTAAVKKGTRMEPEQQKSLIQQLFALPQFAYTPFGKKVYKSLSLQEIQNLLS